MVSYFADFGGKGSEGGRRETGEGGRGGVREGKKG